MAKPVLQLLLRFHLQCFEQRLQGPIALGPERAEHIGNKDAAGFQPHIVILTASLRNKLARNAVGVGGMRDFVERGPVRAARIERIEDHVAALGPVVVRDELAAGVVDQSGLAARLDAVEHLAQDRGLAAAGRAEKGKVPRLDPARHRHRADASAPAPASACTRAASAAAPTTSVPPKHAVAERCDALPAHRAPDTPGDNKPGKKPSNAPTASVLSTRSYCCTHKGSDATVLARNVA